MVRVPEPIVNVSEASKALVPALIRRVGLRIPFLGESRTR
jgi:hypothetical protein